MKKTKRWPLALIFCRKKEDKPTICSIFSNNTGQMWTSFGESVPKIWKFEKEPVSLRGNLPLRGHFCTPDYLPCPLQT